MKSVSPCSSRFLILAVATLLMGARGMALRDAGDHASAQTTSPLVNCDIDNSKLTMDAEELQLFSETNQYRIANGLLPLQADYLLTRVALWKSNEMMLTVGRGGNPAHDDGFRSWEQRFQDCGYTSLFPDTIYGENIDGGRDAGDAAMTDFKLSPLHQANLLKPDYIAVGIKRVKSLDPKDKFKWYWSMEFGSAVDQDLTTALTVLQSGGNPLANLTPGPSSSDDFISGVTGTTNSGN